MLLTLIAAAVLSQPPQTSVDSGVKTIAVLPWIYRGGTDTAIRTANDTLDAFFDKAKCDRIAKVKVISEWQDHLGKSANRENGGEGDAMPELPTPKELLQVGQDLGTDYVCAGRAKWHTKSVWVSLGPKTKAECTVDVEIVDVRNQQVVLDQRGVKADDTKVESGLETAAAVFISMGFTALSGGPKTPHQQKAVQHALALAFEPWLKAAVDTKIK